MRVHEVWNLSSGKKRLAVIQRPLILTLLSIYPSLAWCLKSFFIWSGKIRMLTSCAGKPMKRARQIQLPCTGRFAIVNSNANQF